MDEDESKQPQIEVEAPEASTVAEPQVLAAVAPQSPKVGSFETVTPKKLRVREIKGYDPPRVDVRERSKITHGAALSKWVLSIMSGSIAVLLAYLVWGEIAIGRDIHQFYDHALATNAMNANSSYLGPLEQLRSDLAAARKDASAPFSADALRNGQAALQLANKLPGVTAEEKERLQACIPPPPASESRNEKLNQCTEDLQRIRSLALDAASAASNATLIAQAATELHEQRKSLQAFWLQAAQLILLNLLLPLLTALFGYIFGTQQAQKE
jgi:hypothetical protein